LSGGACATTALVKNGELYVAHLGDCRAVLSRDGGAAVALTADHTCAAEGERERIERGGGYVSCSGSGVWRVQGSLAVSRSFGDVGLKRWVVAEPAVARVPLSAGCEFLVVASDGLWDKVSNQEAVDVVSRSRNAAASSVGRSCSELVELARRRGSRDDVTVMVVDLEKFLR
jgi:protein phosphatase 1L